MTWLRPIRPCLLPCLSLLLMVWCDVVVVVLMMMLMLLMMIGLHAVVSMALLPPLPFLQLFLVVMVKVMMFLS